MSNFFVISSRGLFSFFFGGPLLTLLTLEDKSSEEEEEEASGPDSGDEATYVPLAKASLLKVFKLMDQDGGGRLTKNEFLSSLKLLGYQDDESRRGYRDIQSCKRLWGMLTGGDEDVRDIGDEEFALLFSVFEKYESIIL